MLVVTRKAGQKVIIEVPGYDKPIIISVSKIGGSSVRIGVEAPREFQIFREELIKDKKDGKEV